MKKIILIIASLLLVTNCFAAPVANNFITPQIPTNGKVHFLSTDTPGTPKTLYTAGANGARCYAIWTTNADSVLHALTINIVNATIQYGGATLQTTASAGFGGTATQDIMAANIWPGLPKDQYGNPYVQLVSGDSLTVTFGTAITGGLFLNVVASCSDF